MVKAGIIGYGEIGKAIEAVYFEKGIRPLIKDLNRDDGLDQCDFLHICIPYSENFTKTVSNYAKDLSPKYIVIHSTVAPGTTDSITGCDHVVHSPVRGVHPELYEGIVTFKKIVAGNGAREVAEHFFDLGIEVRIYENAITSEVAKLLSTTYYGMCIAFHDYANKLCDQTGVNYEEAMTQWNTDYNQGYKILGMDHVVRPVLYPPNGKIGGHCVIPNAQILSETMNSPILEAILDLQ